MKPLLLIVTYLGFVLLPLALSWGLGGPPRPVRQEIASALGSVAFSLILVEFLLSGRFKTISDGIGMDVTMRVHRVMARTALIFALLHPFFYGGTPSGGARPWDVTGQLTLNLDVAGLASGIAAFVVLPSFVLLAVARRDLDYTYETWRLMHGVGAVLIAVLLLHHATHAGRYAGVPAVASLWKGMTALAIGSLAYVYVIEPLRQRARAWRVASVRRLAPKQWEVSLAPDGHAGLSYRAGHFAWLNLGHSPFSLHENPFSISSAPAAGPNVSFVIKELGDFTATLGHVQPGTRAFLDGPYGSLTVEGRSEPGVVLVAGGVGIAPMLSILRQMRLTGDPREAKLIYANRVAEQIVYRDELAAFETTYVLSDPPEGWDAEVGLVDDDLLSRVLSDQQFAEWLFVLCGPPAMMDSVERSLIAKGTPSHRILSERFDYD